MSRFSLFPSLSRPFSKDSLLDKLVLGPLELYESFALIPVRFLRRHLPVFGGAFVVLLALYGIFLRLVLHTIHAIFAKLTYTRDPVVNFRFFWLALQQTYVNTSEQLDWSVVHRLFGDAMHSSTSDEDLWLAMEETIALCDDATLVLQREYPRSHSAGRRVYDATRIPQGKIQVARGRKLPLGIWLEQKMAVKERVMRSHLTDGGQVIANKFVVGVLNAETSPGWKIGYLGLSGMSGFVDFPLPKVEKLLSTAWKSVDGAPKDGQVTIANTTSNQSSGEVTHEESTSGSFVQSNSNDVEIPELYDLESMRWALEAILKSLGDLDGLVLDLRYNAGGGSIQSALEVASFFTGPKKKCVLETQERVPLKNQKSCFWWKSSKPTTEDLFGKKKRYYVPTAHRHCRYNGPLVILQNEATRGTAELLIMALMQREHTYRIGCNTAGSLAPTRSIKLPNAWVLDLPFQRCVSWDGQVFEGQGIPPHKAVSSINSSSPKRKADKEFDVGVREALDHIQSL